MSELSGKGEDNESGKLPLVPQSNRVDMQEVVSHAESEAPLIPVIGNAHQVTAAEESLSQPDGVAQHPVEDPVEILVGLAERGEIDPWNINIIEVTDKFLSELEWRRELNLKVSGRTLFYAATLLRMKSEQLGLEPAEEEGSGEEDEDSGDDFGAAFDSEIEYGGRLGPIERLEHEIQRRLDRKNMRKSPITLFELITELKNIEKEERRRRRLSDPNDGMLIDADDVVGIAHEEGYQESSLTTLEDYLLGLDVDGEMTLRELCEKLGWGMPEVYIPLLFLAHEGRCALRQEEFFGDIFVQICGVGE